MKLCSGCGKENQPHYRFCLGCGKALSDATPGTEPKPGPIRIQPVPAPAPEPERCGHCGMRVPSGAAKCPQCGAPL